MDLAEQLKHSIEQLNQPINTILGVLGAEEMAGLYTMPGGQVTRQFMDGTKDQALNFEYAIKSKRQDVASNQLWTVTNYLEGLSDLPSKDGSYIFRDIAITSKPAQSQADEQGFYYWVIDFTVNITTN